MLESTQNCHDQIVANRKPKHQALAVAVFGDKANAFCNRLRWVAKGDRLTVNGKGAAVEAIRTKKRMQQFRALGANETGDAQNLSGIRSKLMSLKTPRLVSFYIAA